MDKNTRRILDTFGKQSTAAMKRNAARYSASGGLEKSIRYEVTDDGLTIYAINYIEWSERGRGKTREGARKGNPTLFESILAWINYKHLPLWRDKKGRFISKRTMAFMISRKIHKEGNLLFRKKGFRNIYSSVLTEKAVRDVVKRMTDDYIVRTSSDFIKIFNTILEKRQVA